MQTKKVLKLPPFFSQVPVLLKWAMPTIREFALHFPYLFSEKASVVTWPAWNDDNIFKLTTILDPFLNEVLIT